MENLIGFEGTILKLEEELIERGYQEISFYQDLDEVLEEENVVVDHETEDKEIQISFEVSNCKGDTEDIGDTKIVVIFAVEVGNDEEKYEEDDEEEF